ncbi:MULTISPECIES: antitoxin [Vagococcus]|uniref:antitoxin n=1 Tax=Vagococcus TaxID=2737 RepID=UPI003B5C6F9C
MTDEQMESKIYQIELLNEFSMSVYNRLLRHVHKNKIDLTHQENFIALLFHQLEETLSLNLFKKELKELEEIKHYWVTMNSLTKEICASDVQTD